MTTQPESPYKDIIQTNFDFDPADIKNMFRVYFVINAPTEFDEAATLDKHITKTSTFIDSKLSEKGKLKAKTLHEEWFKHKNFKRKNSIVISSGLRSAAGTAAIGTDGDNNLYINKRLNEISLAANATPSDDVDSLEQYFKELNFDTHSHTVIYETFEDAEGPIRHKELHKNMFETRCEEEFGKFWNYLIAHETLNKMKGIDKNLIIFGHQGWFTHFSEMHHEFPQWSYNANCSLPFCTVCRFDIVIGMDDKVVFGLPSIDYLQETLEEGHYGHQLHRAFRHIKKHSLKNIYGAHGKLKEADVMGKLQNAHSAVKEHAQNLHEHIKNTIDGGSNVTIEIPEGQEEGVETKAKKGELPEKKVNFSE